MAPASDNDVTVLVIDDSPFNRDSITAMLEGHEGLRVVGVAADGNEGLQKAMTLEPDVITLDLEMPTMDGYTFLRILMSRKPTPVVVISSHSHRESVFKALELGAIDFIAKPARKVAPELETIQNELLEKVVSVGRLRPVKLRAGRSMTASDIHPIAHAEPPASDLLGLVCIGASTGGPPALKEIITSLPGDLPVALLVSQHMPPSFTGPFAERLDRAGPLSVREARDGDRLQPGLVLVAPGSGSLVVTSRPGGELAVTIETAEGAQPRPKIVPSADRMMTSAVSEMGKNVMGVILTGMGTDGAAGIRAVRQAGGATAAESEASAVIFGMPEAAIRTGAVETVVALEGIAEAICAFARGLPR